MNVLCTLEVYLLVCCLCILRIAVALMKSIFCVIYHMWLCSSTGLYGIYQYLYYFGPKPL